MKKRNNNRCTNKNKKNKDECEDNYIISISSIPEPKNGDFNNSNIIENFVEEQSIKNFDLNALKWNNSLLDQYFAQVKNLGQEGCRKSDNVTDINLKNIKNLKKEISTKTNIIIKDEDYIPLYQTYINSVGRKKNISLDINDLNYQNLLDDQLLQNYKKFYIEQFALKVRNPYANTGRKLRAVFIDWIKVKYSNDCPKRDLLLQKIYLINKNEEFAQYILHLLINTNTTQVGLNSLLSKSYLNVSRETVRVIAEENFSNEDYKKKFSKGDGWNKFRSQDSNKLVFSSLLNKELHTFFKKYYHDTGRYANFGKKITNDFINWIKLRNIDSSKKNEIFILIDNINNNKEIKNYIVFNVKNYLNSNSLTKLPLNSFSRKFIPLFLKISDISIGRIIKNSIFKNNEEEFKKMFPAGGREENKIVNLNSLNFEDLLDSSLIDKFNIYKRQCSTSNNPIYANRGLEITNDFVQWINLNEQNIAKRNFFLILCRKINENEEILAYIIHLSLNTNYNLSEIAREIKLIGLSGQHQTVASTVKKYVFNHDEIKYKERFHKTDLVAQNGTSTHLCVNGLISLSFTTIQIVFINITLKLEYFLLLKNRQMDFF